MSLRPVCVILALLVSLAFEASGAVVRGMPPVIGNLPSPTVGNNEDQGGFVFPDAIDLDQFVTDDLTPADQIMWSYTVSGTPLYIINGVDPINISLENVNNPGSKQINSQVGRGESNPDGKASTITIRNINLSPFTGTGATPAQPGITNAQAVTIFASDGTAYSSKTVIFYTDNGGADRLAYPPAPKIDVTPASLDFGTCSIDAVPPPPLAVTITNSGNADLHFGSSGFTLSDSTGQFALAGTADTSPLAPGASRVMSVGYTPRQAATAMAWLTFYTNDPQKPQASVSLRGTGVQGPVPVWVDFAWTGTERGTEGQPWNTLGEALAASSPGATMRIKTGASAEPIRITRPVRLEAVGGLVRLGQGSTPVLKTARIVPVELGTFIIE